jgi:hypothetical protein
MHGSDGHSLIEVHDGLRGDRRLAFGGHDVLVGSAAAKVAPADVHREQGEVHRHGGHDPDPPGTPRRRHPAALPRRHLLSQSSLLQGRGGKKKGKKREASE